MYIIGFLVIASIALIILMWKTAKVWRWYQLLAVFLLFVLACVLPFPTAGILKARSAWHKKKEELEKQAEELKQRNFELLYGSLTDTDGADGVLAWRRRLGDLATETGRRWSGLRLQNPNLQSIVLTAPPKNNPADVADPNAVDGDAAAAAPAPAGPLVPKDLIVYGFAEGRFEGTESPVPNFYLGEFRVTQSQPNSVTIQPTTPLERSQASRITDGTAPNWVLYEMLPLDGHAPFLVGELEQNDENIFGRVDEDLVRKLFGNLNDEKTLQEYLQDGNRWSVATARLEQLQPAGDANADAKQDRGEDPLRTRWTKVEFTKSYKNVYDVDSPTDQPAEEGGFFDVSGRAVDRRLKAGPLGGGEDNKKKAFFIDFSTKDRLIVKEEERNKLVNEEQAAKVIDDYYARQLNDYRFAMPSLRLRLSEAESREKELVFAKSVLDAAVNATNATLTEHQVAKGNLEKDLAQIALELKTLKTYSAKIDAIVKSQRSQLRALYRQNIQLEQKLRALHGLKSNAPAKPKPPAAQPRESSSDFASTR